MFVRWRTHISPAEADAIGQAAFPLPGVLTRERDRPVCAERISSESRVEIPTCTGGIGDRVSGCACVRSSADHQALTLRQSRASVLKL